MINKTVIIKYLLLKIRTHLLFFILENKLFKKGKIKPDGVIDLHGYSLKVGKQNLESYILKSYENNLRNILVITGKGLNNQGVLKKEVPVWLEEKKIKNYLISFEKAPNNNEKAFSNK